MFTRTRSLGFVLLCVLVVTVGTGVGMTSEKVMLIDFENGEESLSQIGYGSSQKDAITYEVVHAPEMAISGEHVLKVQFKASEARGWAVLSFKFPIQDWTEDYAISFWHKGDGRPATEPGHFGLRLGLHDRNLGSYWAKEPDFRIDNTNTEWTRVECKMSEFFRWMGSFYDVEYILWDWAAPHGLNLGVGDGNWLEFTFYIDCVELIKN